MWNPDPTDHCGYYFTKCGYAYINLNGSNLFTLNANATTTVGILPASVTPTYEVASQGVILGSTQMIIGVIQKNRSIKIYNTGKAVKAWIFSFCFPYSDES